jgi:hypothetical protein
VSWLLDALWLNLLPAMTARSIAQLYRWIEAPLYGL